MPLLQQILLAALTLGAGLCLFYWTAGLARFIRTRLTAPLATDARQFPDPDPWPTVCIIIPAYNEQAVIGALLDTLKKQDYPADRLRVVFSLDRCTDGTEQVLREGIGGDGRFIINKVASCPPDWAGKVHALWHAVHHRPEAFDADLLLFIDADTLLHPSCVRWAVKLRQRRGCGLLSLYTTLAKRYWFEHIVQPAAAGELLRQYPVLRSNKGPRSRNMANGQFMLFTREAYFHVGTHKCVQNEVLEDTAMAQIVKGLGHKCEVFFADKAIVCRMYESWPAFVRGWRRLYIELANRRPQRMAKHALTASLTGAAMPIAAAGALALGLLTHRAGWDVTSLLAWCAIATGAWGLLAYYGCMALGVVWGGASILGAILYPLGSLTVAWIILTARRELLAGVPVRWGGKEYTRPPRFRGDGVPIRPAPTPYEIPPRGSLGLGVVVRPLEGADRAAI